MLFIFINVIIYLFLSLEGFTAENDFTTQPVNITVQNLYL